MTNRYSLCAAILLGAFSALFSSCSLSSKPGGPEVRKAGVLPTVTNLNVSMNQWNDAARFLAGMPGGANSPLTAAGQPVHWQRCCQNMEEL